MKFTPNDYVTVKLTECGKSAIREHNKQLQAWIDEQGGSHKVNIEPWDDNDVYRTQFHIIISYFDGMFDLGKKLPFEWMEACE